MSYSRTGTLAAATPLVIRAESPESITGCKMHTLQVVGAVDVAAEVGESGTFTTIGTFTDELRLIEGYGYTAFQLTSAAGATYAMEGRTDEC